MKVMFVVTAFPRFAGDVITPWLVELVERLRGRGMDVTIFTSSYRGLKSGVFNGVRVIRFRYFFAGLERLTHEEHAVDRFGRGLKYKLMSICYILFGLVQIYRECRRDRFDIVHVHWPFPHLFFGYLARLASPVKLVVTFYGAEIRWLRSKFPWLIGVIRYLLRKADAITAISSYTAADLGWIGDRKPMIIPFSAACKVGVGQGGADKKYILFAGRLVERKGVKYLIDAYSMIEARVPHRLVIVGEGPERERLMLQAKNHGLTRRVEFTGWVSQEKKEEYFRNCSLFVNPSIVDARGDTEMLGVVQLEAMAFAKPVVASKVGGIVDTVVHEKSGLLVPPGDVKSLARAMLAVLSDADWGKKLGAKGKTILEEKFSWDTIVNQIVHVYEKHN